MKTSLVIVSAAALLAACHHNPPRQPNAPNLLWTGAKTYSTGSVAIAVSGFGIDAPLDQLPPAAAGTPFTVTRMLTNNGSVPVAAGYPVNEQIVRLRLVSTGTAIGFVPALIPDIVNITQPGPALAPGASAPVTFTVAVPSCGIYRETLSADMTNVVAESNEADNVGVHYFGVPGTMAVNIAVAPPGPGPVNVWHANPPFGPGNPGPPAWVTNFPAAPTHVFTITPSTPGTTYFYNYRQAPLIGSQGSASTLTGPPPVQPPAAPIAGAVVITNSVAPVAHTNAPATDILTELVVEDFVPKVTAITGDGCRVAQEAAQVKVLHPGR